MLERRSLQAELVELTAKAATLADHIQRAGQSFDTSTIMEVMPELQEVERRIEKVSFDLDQFAQCEEFIPY